MHAPGSCVVQAVSTASFGDEAVCSTGLLKHLHMHASSFVPQALLNSRNSSHLLTPVQYDGNPVIPVKSSRSMRLILSTSSCGQPNTLSPFVARRRTSPTSCMSHNARITRISSIQLGGPVSRTSTAVPTKSRSQGGTHFLFGPYPCV
jgi:hypothetical protein